MRSYYIRVRARATAAVHLQLATGLALEFADLLGKVALDQRRTLPGDLLERLRRDILRQAVEPAGDRVVGIGDVRPVHGEDLVGSPPEQERVRLGEPAIDGLAHVGIGVGHEPPATVESPLGSSSGLPGACMTPSKVRNVVRVSSHVGTCLPLVAVGASGCVDR